MNFTTPKGNKFGPAGFKYNDRKKWSEIKSWSLHQLKELWTDEPNRVELVKDPLLGEASLVLIARNQFEKLTNIIRCIEADRPDLPLKLNLAMSQIASIEQNLADNDFEAAQQSIKTLKTLLSDLNVSKETQKLIPSELSPDEQCTSLTEDKI